MSDISDCVPSSADLRERIRSGRTLLADGALGSLLMERGLGPGEPPETFCLNKPQVLAEIVRLYRRAGAEVFQANTFGASPLKLARYGLADKTREINRAAIRIVREALAGLGHDPDSPGGIGSCPAPAYVWASVGPSGCLLKPYGDTDSERVYESFLEQAQALEQAGPDIVAVETMTDLAEAVLAVRAVRASMPHVPLAATLVFERRRKGFFTIMGNTIAGAAAALADVGADMVGANCGSGIENMVAIAREFRAATRLPLVIRPNAGLPEVRRDMTESRSGDSDRVPIPVVVYPETPEFMAARLPELLDQGLAIVGGCCGTTPDHIRAFRKVMSPAGMS